MQRAEPVSVGVLGLGFVGAAMCAALSEAKDEADRPFFRVHGVDLPTDAGRARVEAIMAGRFPFATSDAGLGPAVAAGRREGRLEASVDPDVLSGCEVVVIDVGLDVEDRADGPTFARAGFEAAIRSVGRRLRPGALVVLETTVPPGTCERIVAPVLRDEFARRGLPEDSFLLAHSYERVMPGPRYLDSIRRFWRVYAGTTPAAADACRAFLEKFIATREFPMTRLASTTASELGKVLENSYRATNIAFIDEWGRFAEAIGVDILPVIEAIRVRPTHSNIRQPGFGVGGYCLTKDPLFAAAAARELFDLPSASFPFCRMAVDVNRRMPRHALDTIEATLGSARGKSILLLGISYRDDVADTRSSPSETFRRAAESAGARVVSRDPLVRRWDEFGEDVPEALPSPEGFDAVVLAVAHREYRALDFAAWLGRARPLVVDANRVLSEEQTQGLRRMGCPVFVVGRGLVA